MPPEGPETQHPGQDAARLLRQRQSLHDVIESISSELELRPLLALIVRQACELLGATNGGICLYDRDRNVARIEAGFNIAPELVGTEIPPGAGLAGRLIETRRPVLAERYEQLSPTVTAGYSSHAILGVPIFWRGDFIGSFSIGAEPPRRFDANDVEVLTLYSRHAAIAIENARQYQREAARNERFSLLARMGQVLATDLSPAR